MPRANRIPGFGAFGPVDGDRETLALRDSLIKRVVVPKVYYQNAILQYAAFNFKSVAGYRQRGIVRRRKCENRRQRKRAERPRDEREGQQQGEYAPPRGVGLF
jgi:hypothetical protein